MKFEISLNGLFGGPALFFGLIAAAFVLVVLAAFRDWRRLKYGMLGGLIGYIVLGTELGHWEGRRAAARGACGDAAWVGPAKGLILGAIAATIVYEIYRRTGHGKEVRAPKHSVRRSAP